MAVAKHFQVTASGDSHFAWLRTKMAAERTFMAWLRTATSMIAFGFTLVEFFAKLSDLQSVRVALRPHAPRTLGLMLIGAGVISLALALRQFLEVTRHLDGPEFAPVRAKSPPASPTLVLAIAILGIGVFAFAAIVLRLP